MLQQDRVLETCTQKAPAADVGLHLRLLLCIEKGAGPDQRCRQRRHRACGHSSERRCQRKLDSPKKMRKICHDPDDVLIILRIHHHVALLFAVLDIND